MDLNRFGSHSLYQWTHQHLIDVLTSGKDPILKDPLLINAFKTIKREDFVPEEYKDNAYTDRPIDIGYGQTISSPTTVALMMNLLKPAAGKKYLDIGAGSGYALAIMAFVAGKDGFVYAIERNQYLADFARNNIAKYPELFDRVKVIFRDGRDGYLEKAPYDFVHVAAAYDVIPKVLKNQLVVGGRMISPTADNDLRLIERTSPTDFDERIHDGYIFVPIREGIE